MYRRKGQDLYPGGQDSSQRSPCMAGGSHSPSLGVAFHLENVRNITHVEVLL